MKLKRIYAVMAAGGLIGAVAAFIQTLEKLALLKGADKPLVCDINSVFSCTNVLNAWQSSLFGFPNSIMCLVLFVIFSVAALAGLSGGTLTRGFRLSVQGLSLFTLGFALWFLQQSTFSIGALCLYCIICFIGLLGVNWAWLRINLNDLPVKQTWKDGLSKGVAKGADTFAWILLGLLVAFVLLLKFA